MNETGLNASQSPADEQVAVYEHIAVLTGNMLDAARARDWRQFEALGSQCSALVQGFSADEPIRLSSESLRLRKLALLQKILQDDRAIREITTPWMSEVQNLLRKTKTQMRLGDAYGHHDHQRP